MNAREAAAVAKKYVKEILADEEPTDVGLEEIEFDDTKGAWNITIGFSRPWNSPRKGLAQIGAHPLSDLSESYRKRAYRIIQIKDADQEVISMKKRVFSNENISDTY
jgi:hypothetical protein